MRANGATVGVTTVGGCCRVVVSLDGEDRTVLKVTHPGDYFLNGARWSPHGRWILVADNLNRVIVMVADGDPKPRILFRDASLLSLDLVHPHVSRPRMSGPPRNAGDGPTGQAAWRS